MENQSEGKPSPKILLNPLEAEMKYENKAILAIAEFCGGVAYADDVLECYRELYKGRQITNFVFLSHVIFLEKRGYLRKKSTEDLKVTLEILYETEEWKNSNCYKPWKDFVRCVKEQLPLEHAAVARYNGWLQIVDK